MKRWLGFGLVAALGIAAAVVLTPASSVHAQQNQKIGICHGTASKTNPYVYILVDQSAVKGHLDGSGPGHGEKNYRDFLSMDGNCEVRSAPPTGAS